MAVFPVLTAVRFRLRAAVFPVGIAGLALRRGRHPSMEDWVGLFAAGLPGFRDSRVLHADSAPAPHPFAHPRGLRALFRYKGRALLSTSRTACRIPAWESPLALLVRPLFGN